MKAATALAALVLAVPTAPLLSRQPPQAPPAQAKPAPGPQATPAPPPLPEGARIGYCSVAAVAQQSKEGRAAFEKVNLLRIEKLNAIEAKTKAMQANQALLDSSAISNERRAALQKEVTRQDTEIERMRQDAQAAVSELATEMQDAFGKRVMPIIAQLVKEKGLHMVLRAEGDAILWAEPGLDLTTEIVKRLDAAAPAEAKK